MEGNNQNEIMINWQICKKKGVLFSLVSNWLTKINFITSTLVIKHKYREQKYWKEILMNIILRFNPESFRMGIWVLRLFVGSELLKVRSQFPKNLS